MTRSYPLRLGVFTRTPAEKGAKNSPRLTPKGCEDRRESLYCDAGLGALSSADVG